MNFKIKQTLFFLSISSILFSQNNYKEVEKRFNEMNNNSTLKIEFNEKIYNQINKYLNENNMDKVFAVFRFYNEMFDLKFTKYSVPVELKYLSIIESRLNGSTLSSAGAVGMWQIMPETGTELNLRKDHYINDWLNPIASTDASANYLFKSYRNLKNWNLVLVSYNCGIGNVNKAIKKSGSKNIWKVYNYLPKETRDYIIRFYAIKYIDTFGDYHNFYPKKLKYDYKDVDTFFYNGKQKIIKDNWFYFLNPHILTKNIPKGTPINYINK